MRRFSRAVVLTISTMVGAGCGSSATPTMPSAHSDPPLQTFTVSGVVTELTAAGMVPVAGALAEETRSERRATSDVDGRYRISGLTIGSAVVRTAKAGYVTSIRNVDIRADVSLDIQMVTETAYVISGVAYENTSAGRVVVEGVLLYCDSCGAPEGHTFTSTDGQGFYRFAWSRVGVPFPPGFENWLRPGQPERQLRWHARIRQRNSRRRYSAGH